jgi:uncharacterized small protein (DUF1192 family)
MDLEARIAELEMELERARQHRAEDLKKVEDLELRLDAMDGCLQTYCKDEGQNAKDIQVLNVWRTELDQRIKGFSE